jgi:hypothetical protein
MHYIIRVDDGVTPEDLNDAIESILMSIPIDDVSTIELKLLDSLVNSEYDVIYAELDINGETIVIYEKE